MDASEEQARQAFLDMIRAGIREHGWVVQFTQRRTGTVGYTVGLTDAGLPELAIFSAPPEVAAAILNDLARQSLADELAPGREYTVAIADKPFEVFPLPGMHRAVLLRTATAVYGSRVKALRVQVKL